MQSQADSGGHGQRQTLAYRKRQPTEYRLGDRGTLGCLGRWACTSRSVRIAAGNGLDKVNRVAKVGQLVLSSRVALDRTYHKDQGGALSLLPIAAGKHRALVDINLHTFSRVQCPIHRTRDHLLCDHWTISRQFPVAYNRDVPCEGSHSMAHWHTCTGWGESSERTVLHSSYGRHT